MTQGTCRDCLIAATTLRRMGFRDSIEWAVYPEAPTRVLHAGHSNSGKWIDTHGKRGWSMVALCTTYRSELGWLAANRPGRVIVYVAHPLTNGQHGFQANRANAEEWLKWLRLQSTQTLSELVGFEYQARPLIQAPWLAGLVPDGDYPGGREAVIRDCTDTAWMFDEVWCVGGEMTPGMKAEVAAGRGVVRDLTHLGRYPTRRGL